MAFLCVRVGAQDAKQTGEARRLRHRRWGLLVKEMQSVAQLQKRFSPSARGRPPSSPVHFFLHF